MKRRNWYFVLLTFLMGFFLSIPIGYSAVDFYTAIGSNPDGDLEFQDALEGSSFSEQDFDEYELNEVVQFFMAQNIGVSVSVLEGFGNPFGPSILAGQTFNNDPETIWGGVLLNGGTSLYGNPDYRSPQLVFDFSEPVKGFGTWIFDDMQCCNFQFVMYVEEEGGAISESTSIDNGMGQGGYEVDGFIGAISDVGITQAVVEIQNLDGNWALGSFFELDHVQIAPFEKTACSADVNGDGVVGVNDLLDLLAAWGSNNPNADVNGDGIVGVNDLLDLLAAWGPCP